MKLITRIFAVITMAYSGLLMADTQVQISTQGGPNGAVVMQVTYTEYTGTQQPGDGGIWQVNEFFSSENDGGMAIFASDPNGNPTQATCTTFGGFDPDFEGLRDVLKRPMPGNTIKVTVHPTTGDCSYAGLYFDSRLVQN